jgi:ergothioneine biosynthesis protein EgtB
MLDRSALLRAFRCARQCTVDLCAPLEIEDYVVQAMPEASPAKWHLGHTTWFFERAILVDRPGYRVCHADYSFLFNSYYHAFGARWNRNRRGVLSRPTVSEVLAYRRHVDDRIVALLTTADEPTIDEIAMSIELGVHHEQQHQELLVTDIKAALGQPPLYTPYRTRDDSGKEPVVLKGTGAMTSFAGGRYQIGFAADGFAYDNEQPAHDVWLQPFALCDDLVTSGEFLEFVEDGGYERPELWLADGWETVQVQGWTSPHYWVQSAGRWQVYSMFGVHDMAPADPLTHVSYFEADAFARWKQMRLPTEAEWEVAAQKLGHDELRDGSFLESRQFHPAAPRGEGSPLRQLFGEVWQWTASSYMPYPGFQPLGGRFKEYNGKFMNGQYVLRGGSCATPRSHMRMTYRNFFQPDKRWQFTGIRLAA